MSDFREDREAFHDESYGHTKVKKLTKVNTNNSSLAVNMGKVFLYMFIGLAITAAISFGLGYFIYTEYATKGEAVFNVYLGLLIGSAIGLFILMLIINFVVIRGKHSVLVPGILYAVLMGVLLSTFTLFIDWKILGMAFGITSGIFLIMTLISLISKGNMSAFGVLALGLLIGSGILILVNLLLRSETLYWVISFAIFAVLMFVTMYDIYNIKKICENGAMSNNLALYCAFNIYVDFINIFIRIVYYLLIIFGNKK